MLLTISTTLRPATDLGYLLHKNPAKAQAFTLTFGQAHVFYPEASEERCTCALLLDVDPVGLVRGKGASDGPLAQYVNDRPYTASSFLSVAIAEVFSSALSGRSKDRPELASTAIPLEAVVAVLPCKGGEALLRRLFEPLGYHLEVASPGVPYLTVKLSATTRLADLLRHLYVLIPVLDNQKHYFVGDDEVAKLLRHGEGWLGDHPERELIAKRYMKYRSSLAREAIARLAPDWEEDEAPEPERRVSLHQQRLEAVAAELKQCGAKRVVDLGCGEGRLIRLLLEEPAFERILGMDVSLRSLENAADRLRLNQLAHVARRVELIHGSLTYRDDRLTGYDAAAVVEVIEHMDPPRLAAFERVLFEAARPSTVVLTTPNREYNALYEGMADGALRHDDHRFEWNRAEFATWATGVAERFGYTVRLAPVGPEDPEKGAPSQMAVFALRSEESPV